jgi:hypothetical protein
LLLLLLVLLLLLLLLWFGRRNRLWGCNRLGWCRAIGIICHLQVDISPHIIIDCERYPFYSPVQYGEHKGEKV